jgi:hypothetical protein
MSFSLCLRFQMFKTSFPKKMNILLLLQTAFVLSIITPRPSHLISSKEKKLHSESESPDSRKPETVCGEFVTSKARPAYTEEVPTNRHIFGPSSNLVWAAPNMGWTVRPARQYCGQASPVNSSAGRKFQRRQAVRDLGLDHDS